MPDFLTLSEFKSFIRVDWSDEDAHLTSLLDAAESYFGDPKNGLLGRPIVRQTFSEKFATFGDVHLQHPDGATITSIDYLDPDGASQTLGAIYEVEGPSLDLLPDETWPQHKGKVTVTYSAGFDTVPPQIKQACYLYASSQWEGGTTMDAVGMADRVIPIMIGGFVRKNI